MDEKKLTTDQVGSEFVPLRKLLGTPVPTEKFLVIAIRIAAALREVHSKNIIHRNIHPGIILVHPITHEVRISGFEFAVEFSPNALASSIALEGNPRYLSPEQTGRMNRRVDFRSDLYSLGIVFFEMLVGRLPFEAVDTLGWIHCHVAKAPPEPHAAVKTIPQVLSQITLRLLAKVGEDRYQTASGLLADLSKCLLLYQDTGSIENFSLGQEDVSGELHFSQKLYGREEEVATLNRVFDRIVTSEKPEILSVAGFSGIGKSSLVHELYKPIVRTRGYFVSGKFDQYKKHIPYSAFIQAIQELIQLILSQEEDQVTYWKTKILSAVGNRGRVVTDIVPDLELLIGEQPPVPELGPAESQNRFILVFQDFLRVFPNKDHPLVVFLDDMQWADHATLSLLLAILQNDDLGCFLFIPAYRDNEVNPSHPFILMMEAVQKGPIQITSITLQPLATTQVNQLLSDTLHCPAEESHSLSELIYNKTEGNPFFVNEFLKTLLQDGLLSFDFQAKLWKWDLKKIENRNITDNVVTLMIGRIQKLSEATQKVLGLASFIGNSFELAYLSVVCERSVEQTELALQPALTTGLILPLSSRSSPKAQRIYRFQHDRIQQAAYALIEEDQKPLIHLNIGRLLLKNLDPSQVEAKIFDIVSHLNFGTALIEDPSEIDHLLQLNLEAGLKAKAATAYSTAQKHLGVANALLPLQAWEENYQRTFKVKKELAECEYLAGNLQPAEELFNEALTHAKSDLERGSIFYLQMKLYQVAGNYDRATEIALQSFEKFGLKVPRNETELAQAIQDETSAAEKQLNGRRPADLLTAPLMKDPVAEMVALLLESSGPPIYMVKSGWFPWITLKLLNISLEKGNAEASCYAYGIYGILLSAVFQQVGKGFEFAQLAIDLSNLLDAVKSKGSSLHLMGDHVNFWKNPIATDMPILERGFVACVEAGDLIYSNYIGFQSPWHLFETGATLEEVYKYTEKYLSFAYRSKHMPVYQTIRLEQQFVRNLQGLTQGADTFNSGEFREESAIDEITKAKFGCGIVYYHILKLICRYLHGDFKGALLSAENAQKDLGSAFSMPIQISYYFFYGLTLCSSYPNTDDAEKPGVLKKLYEIRELFSVWTKGCSSNFECKYLIVSAEISRIESKINEALELYDRAIQAAQDAHALQYEAIANELAGKFYLERKANLAGRSYLSTARELYLKWGAKVKASELEASTRTRRFGKESKTYRGSASAEELDLLSVIKASQTLSSEIVFSRLLETLMKIVIEHAGADKGYLLLKHSDQLKIEAEANLNQEGSASVSQSQNKGVSSEYLPTGVINYVMRTRKRVILDQSTSATFLDDPYLIQNRPRSALCFPLVRQGNLVGLIYLENNLVFDAFTPERLNFMEILATQMAISMENSQLFKASQDAVQLRDEFISVASHELKTPLTPFRFHVDELTDYLNTEIFTSIPQERLVKLLAGIRQQMNRFTHLIDSLLEVSRIETGKITLDRQPTNLSDLLQNIKDTFSHELRRAGCTLIVNAEEGILGQWDSLRIEQLVNNLIHNAIKYAPGRPIHLELARQNQMAVLKVRDQGKGIAPENQVRIFQRYEQVKDGSTVGGLGLGLYICQEIIRAHHGQISVKSELGKGAEFTVQLPLE